MDVAGGGLGDDAELAALRDVLAALGATAPQLVYRKMLTRSDVDEKLSRLQVPCRRSDGGDDASALSEFLTASERYCVGEYDHDHHFPHARGIDVPVFDRFGRRFNMTLRKFQTNRSYRFLGSEWSRFVRDNELAQGMVVAKEMGRELGLELWAFRSPELAAAAHNPGGALGMAILIKIKERSST